MGTRCKEVEMAVLNSSKRLGLVLNKADLVSYVSKLKTTWNWTVYASFLFCLSIQYIAKTMLNDLICFVNHSFATSLLTINFHSQVVIFFRRLRQQNKSFQVHLDFY